MKTVGRSGSGPGEIRYLAGFWRCGDNILTYDIENGYRVSVFALDLSYWRSFRFGSPVKETPYADACNSKQQFIHYGWESREKLKPGTYRTNVPFWFSNADEAVGASIGNFPGSERHVGSYEGSPTTEPLPMGKLPQIAIGSSRAYIGTADSFAIMVFDMKGTRIGTIQERREQIPVTKADIADALEREIAADGERSRQMHTHDFGEMTFPKFLPAYSALVVDALDNLWVQDYRHWKCIHGELDCVQYKWRKHRARYTPFQFRRFRN